ncbi:MAG: caspase family protein [Treponema sp.]|nr:caspase family protein [Treponema sp.]
MPAKAVADALAGIGYRVTPLCDATRKGIDQAIAAFHDALAADRKSEGFFYCAGYGAQANGVNYLISVGAEINTSANLDDEGVSLLRLLGNLEEGRNRVNVIVLFSTAEGQVAQNGEGRNSPFASALVAHLSNPGDSARQKVAQYLRNSIPI